MDEIMNPLIEKLSLLQATVSVMSSQITDVHKAIHGNGNPGLLKDFQDHIMSDIKFRWKVAFGIIFVMAAGGASGVGFLEMLKKIVLAVN